MLVFDVTDIDASVQSMLSQGCALDGPITYPAHGRLAALISEDGHRIGLFEPAE
jgi:predicted enzyme related to lactoylglutathione lyase